VHALGQVISFNIEHTPDLERLSYSLSSLLKGEVAVVRAAIMPNFFHPRKGVKRKKYLYRIVNRRTPLTHDYGRAWHVVAPLPLVHLQQELESLIGEHDFTSFRAAGCQARSSVKIIDGISVSNHGDELQILIEGSGFLKHMVRIIVGTAVARVKGWPKLAPMFDILMSRRRTAAGPTAPAHGLTLAEVNYYNWPAIQEWKASHR
jgi:tRNA pseudouridine38-40 synthase